MNAHSCDSVYLREVLENDTRRLERNVGVCLRVLDPVEDLLDIGGLNVELVTVADGGLEQDANGVRQRI